MKIKISSLLILFLLIGFLYPTNLLFDLESGISKSYYNNIRIPGDTGTKLSLTDELKDDYSPYFRGMLKLLFNEKHSLWLLYAPLKIISTGTLNKTVVYQDKAFKKSTSTTGTYIFNSYRLSYQYEYFKNQNWELGIGFTAKIRDAKISLKQDNIYAEKVNVGFVPIINFRFLYKLNNNFSFLLDGDALGAPQGRAEDVYLGSIYSINDKVSFKLGGRILEGGADNDEVYTFSWINYLSIGAIIKI